MHDLSFKETKKEWHGSYRSYVIGFTASLILTITAFILVALKKAEPYTLVALALTQAVFQMRYFLHLGEEDNPKWETMIFIFMLLLLIIIVLGTLWIMHDLDNRVMKDMMHD